MLCVRNRVINGRAEGERRRARPRKDDTMKYLTEHEELTLSEISRTGRDNRTAEEEYGLLRLEKKAKERWGGDPATKDEFLAELADIKMVEAFTLTIYSDGYYD